ncbi:ABC-type uncharacterized transport system, auxiliary component [Desulfacinum hydrothermale DSM 13146]|uniref:ABC-type uncharacterized transport system, auxiliary component n=1 Tax=Desulfacinum hydrothermale DSM 13146 TaxID=1121390 RepID=A0A1W1XMY7_9BACT|nr:ABC-type transport auxiliary lipoprotein family protein [Desulfacinum hydrothermale]SMC25207.1 ABC-type uncharacterized transport system, auxiliary component [Desulfacinum hydrothermale DSM 13146]
MTQRSRQSAVVLAVALMVSAVGCTPLLHPSAPPNYYALSVPPLETFACPQRGISLRVWPFDATQPYDRNEMIIASTSHELTFSSRHRWVASPGEMLAEQIAQALSAGHLFQTVDMAGSPAVQSPWNLAGHLHRFALSTNSNRVQAELEVRVVLWKEGAARRIFWQKTYRLEEVADSVRPEIFAEAMSRAVGCFMNQLARDLCAAMDAVTPTPAPQS